ncbi:MAG: hypothetical protein PHC88_02005 [Terrimicrobiaceae bacterium]|nr:hypothetical protein [Terrimicrobiaceae bacterium]
MAAKTMQKMGEMIGLKNVESFRAFSVRGKRVVITRHHFVGDVDKLLRPGIERRKDPNRLAPGRIELRNLSDPIFVHHLMQMFASFGVKRPSPRVL